MKLEKAINYYETYKKRPQVGFFNVKWGVKTNYATRKRMTWKQCLRFVLKLLLCKSWEKNNVFSGSFASLNQNHIFLASLVSHGWSALLLWLCGFALSFTARISQEGCIATWKEIAFPRLEQNVCIIACGALAHYKRNDYRQAAGASRCQY